MYIPRSCLTPIGSKYIYTCIYSSTERWTCPRWPRISKKFLTFPCQSGYFHVQRDSYVTLVCHIIHVIYTTFYHNMSTYLSSICEAQMRSQLKKLTDEVQSKSMSLALR